MKSIKLSQLLLWSLSLLCLWALPGLAQTAAVPPAPAPPLVAAADTEAPTKAILCPNTLVRATIITIDDQPNYADVTLRVDKVYCGSAEIVGRIPAAADERPANVTRGPRSEPSSISGTS